jgi:hypothetical protein
MPEHQHRPKHGQDQRHPGPGCQHFLENELSQQHGPQGRQVKEQQYPDHVAVQHGEYKSGIAPAVGEGENQQALGMHDELMAAPEKRQKPQTQRCAEDDQRRPQAVQTSALQQAQRQPQ